MSLLAASILGIGLGVKHAVEVDHVAAVCTFVARGQNIGVAAKTGALWGLGHAAVLIVAGGVLVATGATVPASWAFLLEIAVAVMLIGLGCASLRLALGRVSERLPMTAKHDGAKGPFAVGLLHGASGTAALTLVVASTLQVRLEAFAFLGIFGLASMVGMASMAALVAWPLRSVLLGAPGRARMFRGLAGAISIGAGLFVAWSGIASMGLHQNF